MVNSSANYWIAANALSISLNALGEPNRCQCGLATGSVIMCYVSGVEGLEYDNGHNYRRWPLTISPTFFNDNAQKYVYVKIPRTSAIGTTAMICWPSVKLSIEGREVLADGTEGEQIGSTDYYYIWLQGIISSSGDNGQTARTWLEPCQSGTLSTDEAINPEGSQWYSWNNITQQVTFLKEIIMSATSRFFNIRLGNHNLTGVAVDATTDADSDHHIVTPAYVKSVSDDRYLRKDQDDYTPYLLGVNRLESNHIQSTEYTGDGMLDAGYKLWYENGRAKLVIDDLVARGKFSVNELETRIWTYAGGNMVFSGAGSTVFYVEYLDGNGNALGYTYVREPWLLRGKMMLASGIAWAKRKQIQRELTAAEKAQVVKFRCYEYSDDGTMQTRNWWRANDLAYCSSLNHVKDKANSDGSYSGSASNTVFWRRVAGIGSKKIPALNDGRVYDYVDLWNLQNVTGQTYKDTDGSTKTITDSVPGYDSTYNDWPAAGDVIVQRGNAVDVTRQCCVTIEVEGDQLHGFKIYDTINNYSAANTQWVSLGYDLQTGKADAKIYGDCYIGARDQSTYVRYNRTTGVLDIKAKINMASPLGDTGKTFAQTLTAIEGQIDKKAETWRQATDPSSDWTTDTEKAEHVGDLWMDTSANGGKKTYIYTDKGASANPRYTWEAQDVPEEVFDEIDGKGAIYSGWEDWIVGTENKLQVRDLFIPTSNTTVSGVTYKAMKVYKCTTAGATPSFVEVDYTDDTAVNELRANQYVSYLLNGSYDTDIANAAAAYTHDAALNAVKGALKANTVIEGGLMLTSLIALRQLNSGGDPDDPSDYTTWAGVSGEYIDRTTPDPQDPSAPYAKGHGIAAWYGGAMIDYEMLTPEQQADGWGGETYNLRWAKGLDRMDGSGYRASGNISWDANGNVTVKGEDVTAAHYYLSDGTEVTNLLDMFELETDNNNVTWVHVKHGYSFYSDGDISALGAAAGGGGGGGGGAGALYELNDVSPNASGTGVLYAQEGYALVYNGTSNHWEARSVMSSLTAASANALGGIKIGYNGTTAKTYAVQLDSDNKAYVAVPWEDHTYTLAGLMGSTAKGGTTQPIYWDGTEFKNTTYTLGKSVPADAVFTDHYDWNDITSKPTVAIQEDDNNFLTRTNEFNFVGSAFSGDVYFNYRTKGGTDGNITSYILGNGKGGSLGTIIHSGNIGDQSVNYATSAGSAGSASYCSVQATVGSDCATVGAAKTKLGQLVATQEAGVGYNITVGSSFVANWGNDSAAYYDSSVYSFIKIGGGYSGASYGQWLLSSYNLERVGIVGRSGGNWSAIKWFPWLDEVPTMSATNSGYAANADKASDSDKCDGLHVHSGTNNEANKIVRTDGNGYLQCGWINTTSGGFNGDISGIDRIYCSEDQYIRYLSPSDFVKAMQLLQTTGGTMSGAITFSTSGAIRSASGYYQLHISDEYTILGYDNCEQNINTYVDGRNVYVRTGSEHTTKLTVLANGNVGIGTSSPSYKLHVSGTGYFTGHTYFNDWIDVTQGVATRCIELDPPSGTSDGGYIDFHYGGSSADYTSRLIESSSGVVSLYGTFYATGDVTAASDQRKKEFVEDVVLTLEQIANAPAVKFRWKDDRDSLVHIGTYAQYWQDILPESVSDRGGDLGFTYGNTALVAVKNLARYVMQLEEEVRQLKKKQNKSA